MACRIYKLNTVIEESRKRRFVKGWWFGYGNVNP